MKQLTKYAGATTSDTQPVKYMTTMGKVNISDFSIRWVTNISFRLSQLEWVSWTHITPYITSKTNIVTGRSNCILDTLLTEYPQQTFMDSMPMFLFDRWWVVVSQLLPGAPVHIKMSSHQYISFHHIDKTVLRPSYLYNGNWYACKDYWGNSYL